jgi:small-conductance mechanosensitive channel
MSGARQGSLLSQRGLLLPKRGGAPAAAAAPHPLSTRGLYDRPASLRTAAAKILATLAAVAALFMMLTAMQAWLAVPGSGSGSGNGNGGAAGEEEDMDPEELGARRGSTVGSAVLVFLRAVVVVVGLLVALHHAGVRTTTLFALASILSLVVGLAAQSALADHFAGLIFLTEGQLHIGDFVHLVMGAASGGAASGASGGAASGGPSAAGSAASANGMLSGIVQDVTLRRVRLSTFDNETIYVPNSRIVAVINTSQQFPIVRLRVRLPSAAAWATAARVLGEECEAMREDPELLPLLPAAAAPAAPAAAVTRATAKATGAPSSAAAAAAEMRLVRALDAAGMRSPGPEVLGVGHVNGADYEVAVRLMTRVNKQWAAARVVRRRLLARMQREGLAGVPQLVSVNSAEGAAAAAAKEP